MNGLLCEARRTFPQDHKCSTSTPNRAGRLKRPRTEDLIDRFKRETDLRTCVWNIRRAERGDPKYKGPAAEQLYNILIEQTGCKTLDRLKRVIQEAAIPHPD